MSQFSRRALCIILALMMLCGAQAAGVDATVRSDARFYQSASGDSLSVSIPRGARVTMSEASGSWAQVTWKGVAGYMPVKALKADERVAAYANRDTWVYETPSPTADKRAVSMNTKVWVMGKTGDYAWVQNAAGDASGYILSEHLSAKKTADSKKCAWKSKVEKLAWEDGGSSLLKKGKYGYIYDIDTGIAVHIKRMGGVNHADCEPAGKSDTAKLLKIAGGEFSWTSHAVILYAGDRFVACAINTLPHGEATISNNGYDGHFCLHMLGSRTSDSDSVNAEHQKNIQRAYNWARD